MSPPTFRKAPSAETTAAAAGPPASKSNQSYDWPRDSEFLQSCIKDHLEAYFSQVLEVRAATFHTRHQTGRLMTDKDLDEASVELTTAIVAELGRPYAEHMHRYFGDDEGIVGFVMTRVRNALLARARQYNDEFLALAQRRQATARLSFTTQSEEDAK